MSTVRNILKITSTVFFVTQINSAFATFAPVKGCDQEATALAITIEKNTQAALTHHRRLNNITNVGATSETYEYWRQTRKLQNPDFYGFKMTNDQGINHEYNFVFENLDGNCILKQISVE
jgi:hypothetical protein